MSFTCNLRTVENAKLLQPLLLLVAWLVLPAAVKSNDYVLIGVSGGLQEGFPAHSKLHYHHHHHPDPDPEKSSFSSSTTTSHNVSIIPAVYLGRGLVRGYKAYLDVMEEGWREYIAEPDQPVINSNVFASGCYEHANEYWLYLVDGRHVMSVLNNEPRFLSLTPDTGSIELDARETSPLVRNFLQAHINTRITATSAIKIITNVAIPLVTCVYFNPTSHIPSPPIHSYDEEVQQEDGHGMMKMTTITTHVTNFPDSLALWAKVNDSDRTAVADLTKQCASAGYLQEEEAGECPWMMMEAAVKAEQRYWNGIRKAVRHAERNRESILHAVQQSSSSGPPFFQCQKRIRFGVAMGGETYNDNLNNSTTREWSSTRVNYPLTSQQIQSLFQQIGYTVNFVTGEIISETEAPDL